ncbi:methionine--tRNA ligase [Malassezia psittaci]|uniref:Probable methionine--tRNA ligase, mitochondrial n=1 Tax=Malassezia psittaci TaxID=1821823 RepID=A0AAF0FA92_9BASI|nr:methionine--tRNA ligase [Malassezia psittaci]
MWSIGRKGFWELQRAAYVSSNGVGIWTRAYSSHKPYYVTTPIFYVNAEPHIGHLHSDVLADVLCRYQELRTGGWSRTQDNLYPPWTKAQFATGTDEHGMKVQRVAEAQGVTPRALCDRVSQRFRSLADEANLSYTRFIRTTDADHAQAVTAFWVSKASAADNQRLLVQNQFVYLGKHQGWYAVSDEAFYPETQVREVVTENETYHESIETGQRVEWMSETNYKFKLSAFQEPLLRWLETNPNVVQPRGMYERVLNEVRQGLVDLSISRPRSRLNWGIPVPDDEEHTMYVWVDALINYLTAVGYDGTAYPPAWPADVHVVGKDIVRFHAIYWPALLMAAGLRLPHTVVAHAHWTVERAKMSKSKGNSVNPFAVLSKYGTDTTRCFLMRAGGNLSSDADYSESYLQEFQRKYLQGQLGNLLSRILAPKIQARLWERASSDRTIPAPELHLQDDALVTSLQALPDIFDRHMQSFELGRALQSVFDVLGTTNELVQRTSPWSPETDVDGVHRSVYLSCETLRITGILLQAFMPEAMKRMLDLLEIPCEQRTFSWISGDRAGLRRAFPVRKSNDKIVPLFPRIQ